MTKCNRIGCNKDGFHVQVPIDDGMFFVDAYFCAEHHVEGVKSLQEALKR